MRKICSKLVPRNHTQYWKDMRSDRFIESMENDHTFLEYHYCWHVVCIIQTYLYFLDSNPVFSFFFVAREDRSAQSPWLWCAIWCLVIGNHINGGCYWTFSISQVEFCIWPVKSSGTRRSAQVIPKWKWKSLHSGIC